MAVGQEAVVADALKAGRNGVLQEAADELVGGEGHHLGLVAVPVILPLEGNLAVFESQGGQGRFGLWTREGGALLSARRDAFAPTLRDGGAALHHLDVMLLQVALDRLC